MKTEVLKFFVEDELNPSGVSSSAMGSLYKILVDQSKVRHNNPRSKASSFKLS